MRADLVESPSTPKSGAYIFIAFMKSKMSLFITFPVKNKSSE